MTGAIAGSTATLFRELMDRLQVVTLTINNKCNLHCPHCYLQREDSSAVIGDVTLNAVLDSSAHHISIVGKEPLVDDVSVSVTERVINQCTLIGKSVSLTTNGLGLHRLSKTALSKLEWIDVSLDGGAATYSEYRRGHFDRLIQNVRWCLERGVRYINALHTVSSLNIMNIEDMMSITDLLHWNKILFSPYAPLEGRENAISPVSLQSFFRAMKGSKRFMQHDRAMLFIGSHAFVNEGLEAAQVANAIEISGLRNKTIHIKYDPLFMGYLRVTYDGYIMTPYKSLYTGDYHPAGMQVEEQTSLDAAYEYLLAA